MAETDDLFFSVAFGARVKEAREKAKFSQTELARRLGLTRSSVANIEAGRQHPTVDRAAMIATVTRCDPGWLLAGTAAAEPPVDAAERIVREMRALAAEKPAIRLVLVMQDGQDVTRHDVLRANCSEPEALNVLALATWWLTRPTSSPADGGDTDGG